MDESRILEECNCNVWLPAECTGTLDFVDDPDDDEDTGIIKGIFRCSLSAIPRILLITHESWCCRPFFFYFFFMCEMSHWQKLNHSILALIRITVQIEKFLTEFFYHRGTGAIARIRGISCLLTDVCGLRVFLVTSARGWRRFSLCLSVCLHGITRNVLNGF